MAVPETTPLSVLLEAQQEKHAHLALVVDKYGTEVRRGFRSHLNVPARCRHLSSAPLLPQRCPRLNKLRLRRAPVR